MALDDVLDEHEQSERVLAWLRRNGAGLVGGILLGLAAIYGWKWWQAREASEQAATATRYQAAVDAIAAGNLAEQSKIQALEPGLYRTLGSLAVARAQVEQNQRDAAIETLRSIRAEDPALAAIVNERLARLLIDGQKAQDALKLLESSETAGALEVRGDAYFALGQPERARESYTRALTLLEVDAPQRRLVELKLTQVGGTPSKPEART
ncbi:YfgM family protein [Lysobacter korlensis]|uniref:Ancillary SecYEG translocon subunit n=1 Tax=Lysobacter korlensis TaxID=553636 RepID=A0ABV6RLC1_9GAMM